MISRIVACLLFVVCSSIAHSQSLQLRGGLNYSTITSAEFKYQTGFYAGIQKEFPLSSERIQFQPGIYYSLQPTKDPALRYLFHYIHVPAFFNFKIGENAGLLAGSQASLLFHATRKEINNGDTEPFTARLNTIGLSLGGGVYVNASSNVKVELRFTRDILPVGRGKGDDYWARFQLGVVWSISKSSDE